MVKKIDRRKLLGEVLAKQITPKALETYREGYQYPPIHHQQKYSTDKIARTRTNQPNQFGLPAKQRNSTLQKPDIKLLKNPIPNDNTKDLYKDIPKIDYDLNFPKNFLFIDEPIKKPNLNVKEDKDLQNGLGSLIRVQDWVYR